MNVFNMINGGGGLGSGLYVWKKYKLIPAEYASNPSFTLGAPNSGVYIINISNPSFDLSNIPILGTSGVAPFGDLQGDDYKKVIDFFDGFRFDDTCYIEKSVYDTSRGNSLRYHNNGNTWWISGFYKSRSSYGFYVYQATANGVSATLTYTGEKELVPARTGDFIGYVISEDSTTYPDGGEQGGYYYESFTPYGIDAFGCTKYETGSFTVTSTTTSWKITHSLGVVPKFVILYRADTGTQYLSHAVYTFTTAGTYGGGGCASMSTSTNANYENLSNASSTYVQLSTTNLSSFYFYGTLKYIILA